ncbi:relaxase/mobilization nuclease domain-containing protein [Falsiroseomonas sp. HC035]|uniref:relaxase/mobilization nuclease domain-containing protein n=1 Tax=Falsiroseomonas sp. HC035 TaxID=3390999 RepID=UPI003D32242F
MTARDDDLHVRPGRIGDTRAPTRRARSFVGQVMRAVRKAGHTGPGFGHGTRGAGRSRFGRGRAAAAQTALRSPSRRVVVKARVVRHQGTRFRSASLATHIGYLQREGVTRDGAKARLFDPDSDNANGPDFAERCTDDRHHFRFIVSPEDAPVLVDLKAWTRDLMRRAERDLGSRLDWVAVDHWNTDNPHVHVLVRGRAEDGGDLVISRDYISRGFRGRAEALVELELGPRTDKEIRSALEAEVGAERWTGLDGALRAAADEGGGILDLRPAGADAADPELRRLMIGRAQTLERFGLAERHGPAVWMLRPGMEETLRALGTRGDIIRTMHRALQKLGAERAAGDFAIHGERPVPIIGRLVERGIGDELKGRGYAIIDGIDGRVHHLRFADIEAAGDGHPGAVVELRRYQDAGGRERSALAVRSDLPVEAQITANGATWLDRRLVDREALPLAGQGFGAEVEGALARRTEHLVAAGLARRQGQRVVFARDLLNTLCQRELEAAAARVTAETGKPWRPARERDSVAGVFTRRLDLASGRFAMIDDGLGFQLVPWKPSMERQRGLAVTGSIAPGGGLELTPTRKRGLSL